MSTGRTDPAAPSQVAKVLDEQIGNHLLLTLVILLAASGAHVCASASLWRNGGGPGKIARKLEPSCMACGYGKPPKTGGVERLGGPGGPEGENEIKGEIESEGGIETARENERQAVLGI